MIRFHRKEGEKKMWEKNRKLNSLNSFSISFNCAWAFPFSIIISWFVRNSVEHFFECSQQLFFYFREFFLLHRRVSMAFISNDSRNQLKRRNQFHIINENATTQFSTFLYSLSQWANRFHSTIFLTHDCHDN